MTYMSRDRAQRWVTRIYDWEMLLANAGVNHFVDWDDFRASFQKEFFPLHAEAVATNTLEGNTYFQGTRDVDDYLDEFQDLVSESGYTSPKTIVVKFRRGLNPKITDAVATMAADRPDDLDPEGWYEAAVRIDQNRAMNAAFRGSIEATHLLYREPTTPEDEPKFTDVILPSDKELDVLDIKGMSADNIRHLLQQLSQVGKLPILPTRAKKPVPPNTPPVPRAN